MPLFDDAALPEGLRIYAIGDVHGRLDCLLEAHALVLEDLEARPVADWRLIHVGDYVDRGVDSAAVLDHLAKLRADDDRVVCLMGNHDLMFADFLANKGDMGEVWLANGGDATLVSYGLEQTAVHRLGEAGLRAALLDVVPEAHRTFLDSLAVVAQFGDYLFVHAGINPERPLSKQTIGDLLWIREPFLSWQEDFGVFVVHGHTIRRDGPEVRPNRIDIDTGAFATDILTCVALEGREKQVLTKQGLKPLAL